MNCKLKKVRNIMKADKVVIGSTVFVIADRIIHGMEHEFLLSHGSKSFWTKKTANQFFKIIVE